MSDQTESDPSQPTRDEAEAILKPHYPLFCECIEGAWDEYYERVPEDIRAKLEKRARAGVLHDLMVHHALRVFQNVPSVNFVTSHGYVHLSVQGCVLIRLKKLDEKGRPTNYQTKQVKKLNAGEMLTDIPPALRMVAGYQVNKLHSGLVALLIVAPKGRGIAFKLTIKTYGDGTQPLFAVKEITTSTSSGTTLTKKAQAPEKVKKSE